MLKLVINIQEKDNKLKLVVNKIEEKAFNNATNQEKWTATQIRLAIEKIMKQERESE